MSSRNRRKALKIDVEKIFSELRSKLQTVALESVTIPRLNLRPASVLVPLLIRDSEPRILFTKRTANLRVHGGQISFPGGGRDPADVTLLDTALRETEEELGISKRSVELLGRLNEIPTVTDFRVSPFVGALPANATYSPSVDEIDEVIEVPLRHLLDPQNRRTEKWEFRNVFHDVYFYDYGSHVIWGATGRILNNLLQWGADLPAWKELAS